MELYQQILKYYLDSVYNFRELLLHFEWQFEHELECGDLEDYHYSPPPRKPRYRGESLIFRKIKKKEAEKQNHYQLGLPDSLIQQYFTANYKENQLFSVIFAHWYGLSKKQIRQIADKRIPQHVAVQLLNYFICNPQEESAPKGEQLQQFHYSGTYFIDLGEAEDVPAEYREGRLYLLNRSESFDII